MSKLRNLSRRGWILVGFATFAASVLPVASSSAEASTSVRSTSLGALLATLSDPAPQEADSFGASVAVSGSTAVVGAFGEESNEGNAYIYVKGASGWPTAPTVTLKDPGSGPSGDLFGASVAVSGSTVVIGAYGTPDNSKKGTAYVYVKGASGWPTKPTVTLSDPAAHSSGDNFGSSVAVSGIAIVVGARGTSGDDGAAYVYMKGGSGWPTKPTTTLKDPGATADDAFGFSVAVSGSTTVVGAFGEESYEGKAYIYVNGASGWPTKPTTTLKDPGAAADDTFGSSVGVSGSTAVVGAPETGGFDGASYIYVKGASGWPTKPSATLENPDSTDGDQFGASVAVSGKIAVVGVDPNDSYGEPVCIYKA